jgi:hypothetical protein
MSISAAQADAFYTEALHEGSVWGIKDSAGFPAPEGADAIRVMPFWSRRSRAERVIATVPAYAGFEPEPIPLDAWRSRWLPGLARDRKRVGLNWSGSHATGYDLDPEAVEQSLAAREAHRP